MAAAVGAKEKKGEGERPRFAAQETQRTTTTMMMMLLLRSRKQKGKEGLAKGERCLAVKP